MKIGTISPVIPTRPDPVRDPQTVALEISPQNGWARLNSVNQANTGPNPSQVVNITIQIVMDGNGVRSVQMQPPVRSA